MFRGDFLMCRCPHIEDKPGAGFACCRRLPPTARIEPPCLALIDSVVRALRATSTRKELLALMGAIACDIGFRHYALIHHDDLRTSPSNRVDLKDYPAAVSERLIGQNRYRRDPVIRGCLFADSAFLLSELSSIIRLDSHDRNSFDFGAREGLNEGITVPYVRVGDCMGSCTFAGTRHPEHGTLSRCRPDDRHLRFPSSAQDRGRFSGSHGSDAAIASPPTRLCCPRRARAIQQGDCASLSFNGSDSGSDCGLDAAHRRLHLLEIVERCRLISEDGAGLLDIDTCAKIPSASA